MALFPFYEAFGKELSDTENGNVWYAEYCQKRKISEYEESEAPVFARGRRKRGVDRNIEM